MTGAIPLIRAGAIMPFLRWMRPHGMPVDALLREADLDCFAVDDPDQPVPLFSVLRFVNLAGRMEGPDLPSRVVTPSSLGEIGLIGNVALRGETIRGALSGIVVTMSHHVTHEMMTFRPDPGGAILRDAWGVRLDDESRHNAQQYVAALIQSLCDPSGVARPVFTHVALVAHPVHGVAHLGPRFGDVVVASADGALELRIPNSVVDRPAGSGSRARPPRHPLPQGPLPRGKDSLVPSTRIVVAAMLAHGTPTVERLAAAAGQSVRTFQRRLAAEGMTVTRLVEDIRREGALARLAAGDQPAGVIAASLGYQRQSSLTRAVRRWSGTTPRNIRPKDESSEPL